MPQIFPNNVELALTATLTIGATNVELEVGAQNKIEANGALPLDEGGNYAIASLYHVPDDGTVELVKIVEAVDATNFTIVRGINNTTQQQWEIGDMLIVVVGRWGYENFQNMLDFVLVDENTGNILVDENGKILTSDF